MYLKQWKICKSINELNTKSFLDYIILQMYLYVCFFHLQDFTLVYCLQNLGQKITLYAESTKIPIFTSIQP